MTCAEGYVANGKCNIRPLPPFQDTIDVEGAMPAMLYSLLGLSCVLRFRESHAVILALSV